MKKTQFRMLITSGALFLVTILVTTDGAKAATLFDRDKVRLDLYGILDVGVGYLEHSYAASDVLASTVNSYNLNSSPHSFTGVYSGGISMSRVGVRGQSLFYFGVMVLQYTGVGLRNKAPVNAYSSNGMYGFGVRYRF